MAASISASGPAAAAAGPIPHGRLEVRMMLAAMIHAPAAQDAKKPIGLKIAIATMIPTAPSHSHTRWLRSAISGPARTNADSRGGEPHE